MSLVVYEIPLIILAVGVNGIPAGGSVVRSLVELLAWRSINLTGFHDHSLKADLKRGLVFYPAIGIGATFLVITAAIIAISL